MNVVLFDCFGVLYIDGKARYYEQVLPHYREIREQISDLNGQSDYGLITQDEWYAQMSELTGLSVEEIAQSNVDVQVRNEALLAYSQQLRRRGVKVGLVSNIGTGSMEQFFPEHERELLFDVVVLSGEVGITKPHPRIYELAAERLGVSVGECVMIDDREDNCAGADAAGMKCIQYTDNASTIAHIEELL